jgi:hypothetical protein
MKYTIHICRLRGYEVDAAGAAPDFPFASIDTISFNTMMKEGVVYPWTMELWK